jgi:hypothetical protein
MNNPFIPPAPTQQMKNYKKSRRVLQRPVKRKKKAEALKETIPSRQRLYHT